jgi:tetratricopeptide (TPR) repeat protein
MAYYMTGQDELALAAADNALRLNPEARSTLLVKSVILETLGYLDEARELKENAEFLPEGNWSEQVPVE